MNSRYKEITTCEICGNSDLISILNLGNHPMCDDLIEINSNRVCNEYPIEILFCAKCITAHQRFQVPKEELFPITYHYRSRFTADVLVGMQNFVNSCKFNFGSLEGKKVIDIGCNDGSLLNFFRNEGAITVGVEPTAACFDAQIKGHATYNDFFNENLADRIAQEHGAIDYITFTNVFAHIEDLKGLLSSVRRLMSQGTIVVIENHYLGSVLEGNQFDTFYHEHPRTYSHTSFIHMAQALNAELIGVEFPSRYGGNIRVYIGNKVNVSNSSFVDTELLKITESGFHETFIGLNDKIQTWLESKKNVINNLFKTYGKLRFKAFPGRAAILVKLLQLDDQIASAVYEKPGSLKIGHYLPGTRIPIYSDDELFELPDQSLPIINLAWHIPGEIRSYLNAHQYYGEVVDILHTDDFE